MQATQPDFSKFQVEQNEKKAELRINALKNQLDESKKELIVKENQIKQWQDKAVKAEKDLKQLELKYFDPNTRKKESG